MQRPLHGALRLAKSSGATLIDPTLWLCAAKATALLVGNTVVYRDKSHISDTYAEAVAPVLGERPADGMARESQPRG
ncbi:SGNH hydrolase domain-containing protein [Streptomyces adelaidensis]|uniref:SGNH hydrolase domain-containing protein n=1 Tax=Streptomyces adelaidensis TaxID=2796465 RepID=UPI0027DB6445|nr:SGNH hydrolase domain-containing protein [Streptomyces adelaidensis]